ncbi:MAG: HYR domain-containing protein, partial [Chitinophagaceae bacterium]
MILHCMKTQRTARFLQAVLLLLTLSFLAQPATAQVCPFTVNLSSITPASCNGTNGSIRILTPTGGQSPYTYSWNTVPARTSQNLLSVAPGTYTLKVTDRRGCIVTRVWTVTNTPDIEAPTILCSPTPITVFTEPGLCGAFINFQDNMPIDYRMGGSATGSEADVKSKGPAAGADAAPARDVLKPLISDNCNLVTISGVRLDGQPMSAMYPLGNTSILWTATDAAGNTSQCTQVYTIIDNEFPVITGVPANITLDAQAQNCGRIVTWTAPTASDNCSAIINANWGPGSYFNVGTQTVTYTAADPSGNVTTRSFTVTIRDVEKPIILTCAPDTTVAAGPDCQALPVLPLPVATDNCPSSQLTFSNDAPATFLTGTTVVTWTVRDSSGNSATCQQRVTVADQSAPVPVLAALPDVTGICVATVTPPTASDCSGIITATTADATTYTTQGTHIVHWTFTDASGNSFVQLQNVILRDEEPPTIVCPRNIIAVADAPCGRSLDPGTATGTDNCTVTITGVRNDGRALGDCYPVGTTLVTWTAVDGAGNRASCEQTIVVTPIAISGTVYNDANAGTIDGTPISYAGGQLYVNLVNTVTNTVVASKVLTNGTFTFVAADGLQAGISTYALVLASSATATAAGLPDAAEWVNTAEGAAASTGDGNVNGTFSFGGAVVNGQVIDFGIEARPVPATLNVAPSQVNPGGNIEVTMDPALFAATDIRDLNGAGELRYLHILSFPTNSTSVSFAAAATTAGGPASAVTYTAASFPAAGVYVAANLSGNPLAAIAADPVDGAVSMDFAYKAIDQAGVESNNSGIARQPLTELWIAGTVYNDVDAMKDGAVDGTPVASAEGQPLYVNLMNTSNGAVVASRQVDNNGKYRFTSADGLRSDVATYRLVLTTAPANNWASLPAPAAWWNTGSGSSNGNGPTVNPVAGPNSGQFNFGGPIANGQIIDFGIEARPVPTPLTVAPAQQNPGGTNTVAIAAALFSATDAADISGGEVRFLHILSFPTNTNTVFFAASATSLNGVAGAQNYTAANFPAGGVYVATNAAGNPTSAISVDPVNGAVTIDFVYNAIDQADAESTTSGIARQPLTDLAISGTVYNDANGLTDALINGTPISDASGQLYVNLVDAASNTVVASKSLANGTFSFSTADGLSATVTGYKLVLTSSAAGISAALPDAALWVNTGEGASATSGDGTVNGTYGFAAAVTNGQVIDFGIEARPVPAALTVASSQPNPGGTNLVAIAATLFAATDATDLNNDGKVRYIHIVSFPTNTTTVKFAAASTTLGGASSALTLSAANFPSGGVYIATNTAGNPLSAISVDPVNGNVNIDFFYKAVDQANVESNTSGIARQPLTELVITGRVYDDADGATDGVIDGTPIAAPSAQQLYVNLVDAATGNVMAVRSVTTNNPGFSFGSAAGVTASGMYQLVLSSTAGTVGATALAAVLPSGWVNTGEGTPATIGDGTANGLYTFAAPVTTNTSIDFGIEARPVPTPLTVAPAQVNPGGNNTVAIAASLFSASDASDLNNTGMVKYLHITGFPSNTTSISFTSAATSVGGNYNAVSYTAANFPAGGIYLVADASGAPTAAISVDPTDGSVTIDIPYTAIDQALVESNTTGIARQPLGDLMISGTVYNDANALNDALINGTPISNAGGPLFVNLVRGNTVIATKALTNGTFSFGTADGLSASVANYKLVLAKSATGSVAALPDATNWVNTGEGNSGTSGDGSVDGSFTFSAVVSNGQVIDFGIEARPVPATLNVAPSQVNPGGTANISIAPTLFAATDASDLNNAGLVQYIWITSFPTNTTTVNFSGAATTPGGMTNILSYTAATFPAGGVYIATNSAGNPTTGITVDPVDGTVNVDFTYKAIDQAKVVSNNSGIARQPLTCPAPLITCPEAVTVSNTSNKCGASVNLSAPAASSQCGISSVNGVRNDGQAMNAMFPIGTTTITWTATASNGATVSCTQTVKVNDTQLPTISCGAAITANAVANDCKALVSVAAPTATDNCNVTVAGVRSDALALTAAYPVGTTTITWTATDASGNSASCTQTVTVKDVTAPTLTTPANITSCDNGSGNNKILVASATDNCTTVAITWTLTGATAGSGSGNTVSNNFNVGVTTINWTAKDGANNTITGTTT